MTETFAVAVSGHCDVPNGTYEMVDKAFDAWLKRRGFAPEHKPPSAMKLKAERIRKNKINFQKQQRKERLAHQRKLAKRREAYKLNKLKSSKKIQKLKYSKRNS